MIRITFERDPKFDRCTLCLVFGLISKMVIMVTNYNLIINGGSNFQKNKDREVNCEGLKCFKSKLLLY